MDLIQMGHGSGGRMTHRLIREYFAPTFDLETLNDSAVIDMMPPGRIAVTTDSYVISPLFFPGGDIGHLSVCGTVNDLAVAGARPLYLTAGFIIEEGFPLSDLKRILSSMRAAAEEARIQVVAGDTKVVDRGKGDGVFITTAGIGVIMEGISSDPSNIRPGDKVILSGSVGNHGISVIALRNGIHFEPRVISDARPLNGLVDIMCKKTKNIRVMRDPTRGGLATTLKEIADGSPYGIMIEEDRIAVKPAVKGACELLGLDPLYVANEGILVAISGPEEADQLVAAMRENDAGAEAAVIGEVVSSPGQHVLLKTNIGGLRIIDMLPGDQLPRIC